MSKPIIADISVHLFKIAARFASKEDERNYIMGVHVCPHPKKGATLVATDGHRMMVIHDEHGRCKKPITLKLQPALKLARKHDKSTGESETRWKVVAGNGRTALRGYVGLPLIEGEYPEWWQVVRIAEKARGGSAVAVNPRYLADFGIAARELQGGLNSMRIVPGKTSSDPLMICFPEAPHAFGVLMPIKDSGSRDLPDFMLPMFSRSSTTQRKITNDARPKTKAVIVP